MENERGNALFLILIAVALFAALSYAVTQSSRGGGAGVASEKSGLNAAQVAEYGTNLRTVLMRMTLKGVAASDIMFFSGGVPCASGANCVWAPEGGAAPKLDPPTGMGGWSYTTVSGGWTIQDWGTAAADIIIWTVVSDRDLCVQFNESLGLSTAPFAEDTNANIAFEAYPGEPAACYDVTAGAGENLWLYFGLLAQ